MIIVAVEHGGVFDRHRRHPSGDTTGIGGDVELGDGFGAADAAADVIPVAFAANAKGRDSADAGDDDAGMTRGPHRVTIIPAVHASGRRSPFLATLVAWTGAAVFLASLTYFLFSYSVPFAVPA